MGACLSSVAGADDFSQPADGPLFFHPYIKGSQIIMDESHRVASRAATFHDGILFSNRPIELYEKVTMKILKEEGKWHGGLRVGFTWEDPALLEPRMLPRFACPGLVRRGKSRICVLPDKYGTEGTLISFWVDSHGRVFSTINHEMEACLILDGVLVTSPVWAVVDVYGRTKAVKLLESPSKDLHSLPEECTADECVVCLAAQANTMLLPCCHANFCSSCSLKVLKTSGCCPLCRQVVKRTLRVLALAAIESPEHWLEDGKNTQPLR